MADFVNFMNRRTTPINKTSYLSDLYDLLKRRADPLDDTEWSDVVDFIRSETGESLNRDTVRKSYGMMALYDEAGWVRPPDDVSGSSYDIKRLEAEKAMVRLRDERNEISRIQRELARKESMVDLIREGVRHEIEPRPGYVSHRVEHTDNDVVVHLTDIHGGILIENFFNEYNVDVMYDRLDQYVGKIDEIRQRHGSENCYVMLGGDFVSGLIHTQIRLENNLDVVKQVKVVSSAIADFLEALSGMFGKVFVYSVPGNHGRVQPKKEDNLRGENFDFLVPFIVKLMLANYENVYICEDNVEPTVAMFNVRGMNVFGVHGDKDSMENVVQKLTMVFGIKPDIVLAGHRHTNGMRTVYDSKVIESGCISGPDAYCMDHRLRNKPEQMVLVISNDGLECMYDVTLR